MSKQAKGQKALDDAITDAEFNAMLERFRREERDPDDAVDWPDHQAHEFWATGHDLPPQEEVEQAGPAVGVACPNGHLGCWDRECWKKRDEG